jgi:RNase adaptor protein for sRNA GlmZ degradation
MNNPFTGGVPDVWYSGFKNDLWVEYKYVPKNPVRGSVIFNLSELQKHWLEQRQEEGRNVAIIIGCPAGGVCVTPPTYELLVSDFNRLLKSRVDLAGWIKDQVGA